MGQSSSLINSNIYGRNQKCIEYLQKEFWLTNSNLNQFYFYFNSIFNLNNNLNINKYKYLIHINEFLIYFNIESNSIHKLIFGWLKYDLKNFITFSFLEFVSILMLFLSLNDLEFGKFIFILFDTNRDGLLEYEEITELLNMIKKEDNVKNRPILNILYQLANSDIKTYNMSKFLTLFQKHTALINPFRQLKCELQILCLGTNFWDAKIHERMKPSRSSTKFANLDNYRTIAHDIQQLLNDMESSDPSLERFSLNPNFLNQSASNERSIIRSTVPSTHSNSNTNTKRRSFRRGNSNDDMLDSQGKLHTQGSTRKIQPIGTFQQQKTQKQLIQVGAIIENYQQSGSSLALPKISPYEPSSHDNDDYNRSNNPSIQPSSSSEIYRTSSHSTQSSHHPQSTTSKQPSSSHLLPSVSKRGSGLNNVQSNNSTTISTTTPQTLLHTPSASRLTQQIVLPRGASNRRTIIRRHSSDDLLR